MTADVVARIRAAIAEWRGWAENRTGNWPEPAPGQFVLDVCDWAEDVLDRHRVWVARSGEVAGCFGCTNAWPCPDVRAIATAILGEGWDR